MNSRQDTIDFHRNYCVHYEPRDAKDLCSAGVGHLKIRVETPCGRDGKSMKWGPCIGGHHLTDPCSFCPKWERRSLADAEEYADDMEKAMQNMMIVLPLISNWRVKPKPTQDRYEVLDCPVCKNRLHASQASYNGHCRVQCETSDCINFIE